MPLTGKWKIAEAELGGKTLPPEGYKNLILEMDENSYQILDEIVIDSGIIELFNDSFPKSLRITAIYGPNKGRIFNCIYKFDGKDLIMCYNLGGETRPTSFETFENTLLYLVRYKRV